MNKSKINKSKIKYSSDMSKIIKHEDLTLYEIIEFFEYQNGGYYKDSRVEVGVTATVIHGQELIKLIKKELRGTSK